MRYRPCPTCGTPDRRYRRWPGWLEVICAWCAEPLHGIAVEVVDGEVGREAA